MSKIYEAALTDIPAIIDIAEKTWWPTYSPLLPAEQLRYMLNAIYSHDNLSNAITTRAQTFLMVGDGKVAQGFAAFGKRDDDPGIYKLHKLYVLPGAHGMGYGKILLDEVKRRMRLENILVLDLNVNRFNPARKFYEKAGFKIIREEDVPIGPYFMNDFVMRLEVPGN